MNADVGAVLPNIEDPQAAPFWNAARQGQLTMQRCLICRELRWTPQDTCPSCLSREYEWEVLSGKGKIYSHCTYYRVLNPAFTDVPYTVVMVELDEGPVIIGRLLNGPAEAMIDERVACAFSAISDEMTLVNFTLDK
ncbi:Zn-ribbon domain-containing OB-fold protein [Cryobacterium aureum]|uniref:Zn-ribbon domain-containing OB-fold protein n=1 Tax=Cryobacterium aureum TaxID=995037 RepID=UPI000CF3CC7D|nr:OB-fold domain-containing protein [Cryobacterium aureum]